MFNLVYDNHTIKFGNVTVGFELPYASITYSAVDHGSVTGVAMAQIGSTVTVTATPDSGYTLSYITVNGAQIVGNNFVVTGDTTVGAVFVESDEVTIGTQVWKKHNLAIDDGGGGITIANGEYYYTQDAAIRVAATVNGWHLPSPAELTTLVTNAGGFNGLAATESWRYGGGDNSSGFGALATGGIITFLDPNNPRNIGTSSYCWSNGASPNKACLYLYRTSSDAGVVHVVQVSASLVPVRLIKD